MNSVLLVGALASLGAGPGLRVLAVFDPLRRAVYNHDVSELIDSVRALWCTANGCE